MRLAVPEELFKLVHAFPHIHDQWHKAANQSYTHTHTDTHNDMLRVCVCMCVCVNEKRVYGNRNSLCTLQVPSKYRVKKRDASTNPNYKITRIIVVCFVVNNDPACRFTYGHLVTTFARFKPTRSNRFSLRRGPERHA